MSNVCIVVRWESTTYILEFVPFKTPPGQHVSTTDDEGDKWFKITPEEAIQNSNENQKLIIWNTRNSLTKHISNQYIQKLPFLISIVVGIKSGGQRNLKRHKLISTDNEVENPEDPQVDKDIWTWYLCRRPDKVVD